MTRGLVLVGLLLALLGAVPAHAVAPGSDDGRTLLVLDSSGSMDEPAGGGTTKIAAAKQALRTVVGRLPAGASVGLRVFGATVFSRTDAGACQDSQLVVPSATGNHAALLAAIGRYRPYGETPIPFALEQAAHDLGSTGARTIVLVSDGESTCGDPCVVAGRLANQGFDLHIDVVGLSVSGAARDQLRCIAAQGDGTYYDAQSAPDIVSQIDTVAERAVRPFSISGTPIRGGTADEPTPVTVGDWVDTLEPHGRAGDTKSYVFTRTLAGSTLRAAGFTQGEPGDDGLSITILDPAGHRCDYGTAIRQIDAREIVGVQATAARTSPSSNTPHCDAPGRYLVTVERVSFGDQERIRFGLRISEEPPVDQVGFTGGDRAPRVVPPVATGPLRPVVGGASFDNAATIGPGRWSSTVVPGEAALFRLPLEIGQAARISVTFPVLRGDVGDTVGSYGLLTELTLFDPMRAQLALPLGGRASAAVGTDRTTLLTATPALSDELLGFQSFGGVADYSTAGDYDLSVSLRRADHEIEFPFTIAVQIVGTPRPGPTYVDGATWSVADGATYPPSSPPSSPSSSPSSPSPSPRAAGGSDDEGTPGWVLPLIGGAALLAVGLGAGVLLGRRRSA